MSTQAQVVTKRRTRAVGAGQAQERVVLVVAGSLILIFLVFVPAFRTVENAALLARSVAALGVLGLGMAVVVIGRGLDLSLVSNMAVSGAITLQLMRTYDVVPAVAAGLVLALSIGLLNGLVVAHLEVPALFATLASGLLVYGGFRALYISSELVELPSRNGELIALLGSGRIAGIPIPVLIFLLLAVLVHLMLTRTRLGRFIYAHGDNPETARLSGISVRTLTVIEYMTCAGIGYLAGLLLVGSVGGINTAVASGSMVLDVVLIVVLGGVSLVGGRGGVLSVIAGTVLIGVLLNGMTLMNLSTIQQDILRGLVLLAALLLDNKLHPRDEETVRQGD